jgi:hypothetical protein
MTATKVHQLVMRAMMLAIDDLDEDAVMTELRGIAQGDEQALEQAIRTSLAQPADLATRHRAVELLARVRYEHPSAPH